jgi:hypothetical protein
VALALVLSACGGDTAEETAEAPAQEPGAGAMPGMQGRDGMSGMQMGSDMMAHMGRMQAMGGDSLMRMMPEHRRMLDSMMSQMNREMEGMNMGGDARWTALADSVRDDMARMPEMSAAEMQAYLPEHHARVSRLMEMHGGMMGGR